ncbi:MAG: hypothetical protein ACE5FU_00260 [Nitrospinota bacterium]
MKCPKCGYIGFEYLDDCKKCNKDLAKHKKTFNIVEEKHGFINILKYVELENSVSEELAEIETDTDLTGHAETEGPELTGGDFGSEPEEISSLTEIGTDFGETEASSSQKPGDSPEGVSAPPPDEEFRLDEVNLALEDLEKPVSEQQASAPVEEKEQETGEIAPDFLDTADLSLEASEEAVNKIQSEGAADIETDTNEIEEFDGIEVLLDSDVAEDSTKADETTQAEVLSEQVEAQQTEELDASLEDLGSEEKALPGRHESETEEKGAGEPMEVFLDPEDQAGHPVAEKSGEQTVDLTEALHETTTENQEPLVSLEEPDDSSLKAVPEKPDDDISLDFSLDSSDLIPETRETPAVQADVKDADLELSLDEFDDFTFDMDEVDLAGGVVPDTENQPTGESGPSDHSEKKSQKEKDEKVENRALDIDLEDLYPDQ